MMNDLDKKFDEDINNIDKILSMNENQIDAYLVSNGLDPQKELINAKLKFGYELDEEEVDKLAATSSERINTMLYEITLVFANQLDLASKKKEKIIRSANEKMGGWIFLPAAIFTFFVTASFFVVMESAKTFQKNENEYSIAGFVKIISERYFNLCDNFEIGLSSMIHSSFANSDFYEIKNSRKDMSLSQVERLYAKLSESKSYSSFKSDLNHWDKIHVDNEICYSKPVRENDTIYSMVNYVSREKKGSKIKGYEFIEKPRELNKLSIGSVASLCVEENRISHIFVDNMNGIFSGFSPYDGSYKKIAHDYSITEKVKFSGFIRKTLDHSLKEKEGNDGLTEGSRKIISSLIFQESQDKVLKAKEGDKYSIEAEVKKANGNIIAVKRIIKFEIGNNSSSHIINSGLIISMLKGEKNIPMDLIDVELL